MADKALTTADGDTAVPGDVLYASGRYGVVRVIVHGSDEFTAGLAIECGILGHDVRQCFKDRDNWAEKSPLEDADPRIQLELCKLELSGAIDLLHRAAVCSADGYENHWYESIGRDALKMCREKGWLCSRLMNAAKAEEASDG